MRCHKILLFALFTLVLSGCASNPMVSPISSKIDRSTSNWAERANLIPSAFETGEDIKSVEKKLKRSGFEKTSYSAFTKEKVNNAYDYSRPDAQLFCNTRYHIRTIFNEDHKLLEATGMVVENGCL